MARTCSSECVAGSTNLMCGVQFRHVPGNVFTAKFGQEFDRNTNELVIRIQPHEAIYMTINNKVPGLGLNVKPTRLDLSYSEDLHVGQLPDAYERLLLDVVNGVFLSVSFLFHSASALSLYIWHTFAGTVAATYIHTDIIQRQAIVMNKQL